jgi:hypothetical protein
VHDQRIDLYDDVLLLRLAVRRLAAVLTYAVARMTSKAAKAA